MNEKETETVPTVEECRLNAVRLLREAEITTDLKAKGLTLDLADRWAWLANSLAEMDRL